MSEKRKGFELWWKSRSLPIKILTATGFAVIALALAALFGWALMALWNWIVPDLTGWKPLTYWKAWGLFILCSILFKGSGSGGNGRRTDRKRKEQLRGYMKEEPTAPGAETKDQL